MAWESVGCAPHRHCFVPQNIHVCLGGLFVPEAYITATRQYVAQANSWSLEELCLEVGVTTSQSAALDACSFGVTGESEGVWTQPRASLHMCVRSGGEELGLGRRSARSLPGPVGPWLFPP